MWKNFEKKVQILLLKQLLPLSTNIFLYSSLFLYKGQSKINNFLFNYNQISIILAFF